ncbi:MAG: pilus assembly protein PilM [Alphaproteobacteria bacterium]|nr:pilus assembly protein PilM [Alphaproteobacteria bacterium]
MIDSCFLCLDIGTCGVRGVAHRVRNAMIDKSAYYAVDDFDTVFALKSVADELERQMGTHFDTAYITGNFGNSFFNISTKETVWNGEHKITPSDVKSQISQIDRPDGFYPMHIIPLRYDTGNTHNLLTPIGQSDTKLISKISALFFENERMQKILSLLRQSHIQPSAFYAPQFLASNVLRQKKKNVMFIDFGAEHTTASIWTDRGPVWYDGHFIGGNDLTNEISTKLDIPFAEAERIKRNVANLYSNEMARFSPADTAYAFSCADVNEIVVPFFYNIVEQIRNDSARYIERYNPNEIIITGGGARLNGIVELLSQTFNIEITQTGPDTNVRALAKYIWELARPYRRAYIARLKKWQRTTDKIFGIFHRKKPKKKHQTAVPIMPSTLCFDMSRPETYTMFRAGGISAIHVDIMDGLYVDKITGGIEELRKIRAAWPGHLHVHLMTDAPSAWATDAINAGADTVILSTNTVGLRRAVQIVRAAGKRVGIALNPESSVSLLKTILRNIDEIMVMGVAPGAAGQKFNMNVLNKISVLAGTRKKYGLRFTISVDGGINPETARLCWGAGADLLVSGSYLARAADFPLAVMSLLPSAKSI